MMRCFALLAALLAPSLAAAQSLLPDGTTATTQPSGDNSALVATDAFVLGSARPKLLSTTTFDVRTDGSDSACNGLSDAAATSAPSCAFGTWQAAFANLQNYDFNGQTVVIQAGSETGVETWNESACSYIYTLVGGGSLYIRGNGNDTVINGAGGAICLQSVGEVNVFLGSMLLESGPLSGGANAYGTVLVAGNSRLQLDPAGGPNFGNSPTADIWVHDNQATATLVSSTYSISGTKAWHIMVANGGHVFHESDTVNLIGTPTFNAFLVATEGGTFQSNGADTFNGNAIGARFVAQLGGLIDTFGQGVNYLPGSTPGYACTGGIFTDDVGVPCGHWGATDASGAGLTFPVNNCSFWSPVGHSQISCVIQFPTNESADAAAIGGLPLNAAGPAVAPCTAVYGNTTITGVIAASGATMALFTPGGVPVENETLSNAYLQFSCSYPAAG